MRKSWTVPLLIAVSIPVIMVLGAYFDVAVAYLAVYAVFAAIVAGAAALWQHANGHADGSEWWQDDSASGWRGY